MELTVTREPTRKSATLGVLTVDGAFECDTLEDVIREVPGVPVAEWKVKHETAIPQGRYKVTLVNSPSFGPNTLAVLGVEGFSEIRIHAGNDDRATSGCLLVGSRSGTAYITASRAALARLKLKVTTAIFRGEEVWITYINPQSEA